MSYKDGIPLLTTFEDEGDDLDDYMMGSVTPRKRCKKRHILFGVVLCFAAVLVVGLAVSVSLGVTLTSSGGEERSLVMTVSEMMSSPDVVSMVATSSIVRSGVSLTPSTTSTATHPTNSGASSTSSPAPPTSSSVDFASSTSSPAPPTSSSVDIAPSTSSPIAPTPSAISPMLSSTQEAFPSSSPPEIFPPTSLAEPPSTTYERASFTAMLPSPTPFPPMGDCLDDDSLCRSPNDQRTYESYTLTNGLRVVLVSDPATDLSGASMNVAAGSFNDPSNFTGLAHFCEHMLFLGTTAYPEENLYSNFLSTHGGYDNAYTSTQETDYYFRVNSAYLRDPLDMFANFFIDPLLSDDSTASEMYAVNQEHEKNLHSDAWKLWQLLKNVSNPKHPFSQFSTGNFDTLNKSGVNMQLREYYERNYAANNMFLAVYGRENTSVLSDWIIASFSSINSSADADLPATYSTTAFPPPYTGRLIYYFPEASTNTLTLYWQTPPLQGHRRNSVSDFLIRYLGHEGESSLFHHMQRNGFASAVQAGVEVAADSFELFSLQITLTEGGLDNVAEVVRTVFYFTHLLASLTEEDFLDKWDDYCEMTTVNFDYAENEPPDEYTKSITEVMRLVNNSADVLPNPRRYQPDHLLTISTARCFTPNNTLIFIGTHSNSTTAMPTDPIQLLIPVLDEVEPIYGTSFHNAALSEEFLTYWTYNETWEWLYNTIAVAGRNQFIPQDLFVLATPPMSEPQRTNETCSETWVLQDTELFPQPRVSFRCELRSGSNETSALREALSELFVALVTAKLNPHFYGASEVGYEFDVASTARGLILSFGGLSDSGIMQNTISDTMSTLLNVTDDSVFDDGLFDLVMSDVHDQLVNYNYTVLPFRYTLNYIQNVVLERPYWTHEQLMSAMQDLSLSKVLQFASTTLLNDVSVSCLAHGNVDAATADLFSQMVTDPLSAAARNPPSPSPGFTRTRIQLAAADDYGLSLQALNPVDDNSVVNIIFQAGPVCEIENESLCSESSILRSLHLNLLRQIIADECFTQLRTKEKLGYVVFCFSTVRHGVGSFQTLVQSQVYSPEHVLNSTISFLEAFYDENVLSSNFSHDFDSKVEVLRQTLTKRDLRLEDKTDRLWNQVISGQHQFGFKKQKIDTLNQMSAKGFQDFYNTLLLDAASRRRLLVVMYGMGKSFELPVKNIIDYQSLDQTSTDLPIEKEDLE